MLNKRTSSSFSSSTTSRDYVTFNCNDVLCYYGIEGVRLVPIIHTVVHKLNYHWMKKKVKMMKMRLIVSESKAILIVKLISWSHILRYNLSITLISHSHSQQLLSAP